MDIKTARELTRLFEQQACGRTPHILREAYISFENETQTRINAECRSPVDAALLLEKVLTTQNDRLFDRKDIHHGFLAPVTFSMFVRYRDEDNKNEHVKAGIMLRFTDMDSRSEFHFHGRMTPDGPTAREFVSVLKNSGDKWGNVNFARKAGANPILKRVK